MYTHSIIKNVLLSSLLMTVLATSSAAFADKELAIPNEYECEGLWFPNIDEIFSRSILVHPTFHYQSSMSFKETGKFYTINVLLPYIEKKDIFINVVNNVLVIAAERNVKEKRKNKSQQSYSSYHQSIVLPENADINKIDAIFKKGSLILTIPKNGKKTAKKIVIR